MKTRIVNGSELTPETGLRAEDYVDPKNLDGKFGFATDDSSPFSGGYNTREAAAEMALEDVVCWIGPETTSVTVYTGKLKTLDTMRTMPTPEAIFEVMGELAWETVGEVSENWPPDELKESLIAAHQKWIEENIDKLRLYEVVEVKEHDYQVNWAEEDEEPEFVAI